MEETRNWVEMSDEIMGGMILQHIGALEIMISAQKVCRTWRRICKDPAMWKVVCIDASYHVHDVEKLIKQAVHRSCGELIDISLDVYGTDHLLDYISRFSSKLNRLCLMNGFRITGCGLSNALKRLPHLESLKLSFISINAKDVEVIGRNCRQLKSFKILAIFVTDFNGFAHSIANSMPALRLLQMNGNILVEDDGIRAILNGCPHLESFNISGCFYILLDSNLEKLYKEQIEEF